MVDIGYLKEKIKEFEKDNKNVTYKVKYKEYSLFHKYFIIYRKIKFKDFYLRLKP